MFAGSEIQCNGDANQVCHIGNVLHLVAVPCYSLMTSARRADAGTPKRLLPRRIDEAVPPVHRVVRGDPQRVREHAVVGEWNDDGNGYRAQFRWDVTRRRAPGIRGWWGATDRGADRAAPGSARCSSAHRWSL